MSKTQTLNPKEQAQCNAPVGHCILSVLFVLLCPVWWGGKHSPFCWNTSYLIKDIPLYDEVYMVPRIRQPVTKYHVFKNSWDMKILKWSSSTTTNTFKMMWQNWIWLVTRALWFDLFVCAPRFGQWDNPLERILLVRMGLVILSGTLYY